MSKQSFIKLSKLDLFIAEKLNAWELRSGGRRQLRQVQEDRSIMLSQVVQKHFAEYAATTVLFDLKAHPETAGPIA